MADIALVGKKYPPFTWEVERSKIRELVEAIGDKNPIYRDIKSARDNEYDDTPASPTYTTVPLMWTNILFDVVKDMKINFARILHGEETYEYFKEIYPGDTLLGQMTIADMERKSGKAGDMDIVKIEILYTNRKKENVLKATTVIVERR